MIYFLISALLIVYLEFLGQSLYSLIGKKRAGFSFGAGFILVLASSYITTALLTAFDCSFYIVLIIYSLLFVLSLGLMFKERKNLSIRFGLFDCIAAVIIMAILLAYSVNTTLGDLDGFDTTFYLNMITNNVGIDKLNSRNVFFGDTSYYFEMFYYSFQSYHYLASIMLYYAEKACGLFGIPFYRLPGFVWPNQILFFALTASLFVDGVKKAREKNAGLIFLGFVLIVFYFGRLYFNSVFGFYGNSMRTLIIGQACSYVIDYERSKEKYDRYLVYMALLAACAVSSSGVFLMFFFLFALYFLWIGEEKNLVKEYAPILLLPSINLFTIVLISRYKGIVFGVALALLIWLFSKPLYYLGKDRSRRLAIIALMIILMAALSYLTDGKLYHYSAFVENNSQRYDMTLNYFYFSQEAVEGITYYKYIVLIIVLLSVAMIRNSLTDVDLILIAVFFNPVCCAFLNKVDPVFYRAYDILVNPFTLVWLLNELSVLAPVKYAKAFGTTLLALYLLYFGSVEKPIYYHKSFRPSDDYNMVYKMTQSELEVIDAVKNEIDYNGDENPEIITHNKLTQSMLKEGRFIYGRENIRNNAWSKAEKELYAIFYPVIYFGDPEQPKADYDNMCQYLQEADIRYVVQDRQIEYYDKEQNIWYSMTYVVDKCGEYPVFENDRYVVYRFDWEK